MDYEHDIFISYPRKGPVGAWVDRVFAPNLREWVPMEIADRRIFRDTESVKPGQPWPKHIRRAVHRSKVVIAVYAPPFFTSEWCTAELDTVRRRIDALGLDPAADNFPLYPVRFSDGRHFDDRAQAETCDDFDAHNVLVPGMRAASGFERFLQQLKRLCRALEPRIEGAAPWSADWPLGTPTPSEPSPMPQPRF